MIATAASSAYVESGSGNQLFWWVLFVVLVAIAAGAKRVAERHGRNGWLYFFVTLLSLPVGLILTGWVVLRSRAQTRAG